jgi:hypothetical protein
MVYKAERKSPTNRQPLWEPENLDQQYRIVVQKPDVGIEYPEGFVSFLSASFQILGWRLKLVQGHFGFLFSYSLVTVPLGTVLFELVRITEDTTSR